MTQTNKPLVTVKIVAKKHPFLNKGQLIKGWLEGQNLKIHPYFAPSEMAPTNMALILFSHEFMVSASAILITNASEHVPPNTSHISLQLLASKSAEKLAQEFGIDTLLATQIYLHNLKNKQDQQFAVQCLGRVNMAIRIIGRESMCKIKAIPSPASSN